jgi:hypothetical protein
MEGNQKEEQLTHAGSAVPQVLKKRTRSGEGEDNG